MVQRIKKKLQKGQLIVELLIAFGLASILLPALVTGFVSATQGRETYEQRLAATALIREAEEAIRSFREETWTNIEGLSTSNTYYPVISGNKWVLQSGTPPEVNGFTRTVKMDDVYRDANKDIVDSGTAGATIDPSTKKFDITVTWPGLLINRNVSSTIYITRYSNTFIADNQTVESPSGGYKDWCTPVGPSVTNVNIPHQASAKSVIAFETLDATGNRVFIGTGDSADSPAITNVKIEGNDPPVATILGDYNGTPQIKTNDLTGDSRYAYLATDKGVVILDISQTPYVETLSKPYSPESGATKVNGVAVVGDTGYAVTDKALYIFSIAQDRKSVTQIGSINITGGVRVRVDFSNQYAYVVSSDTTGQLKIVDVHSNPGSLTNSDIKSFGVDGGAGKDVYINDSATRAYLVTAASDTQAEFFIIDITDKANPSVFPDGTYDTNGMDPNGVVVVSGQRAIIVGVNGHEYQVIIVADDKVSFCPNHSNADDFLDIDSGIYAISAVLQSDQHAYSYITTGDSGAELKIIEGGPGTGGVGGNGTYESGTLPIPDPGYDVAWNSFTATIDPNLSYKISIKHGVNGSCSGVTFSDGDFVDFVPGPLPLTTMGTGYTNPGECLRYRAVNSGPDPVTFTINFNYSP